MTVSDIFTESCRGSVFDLPCPASFVGINRVVGNLVVEPDPTFGGGHLTVSGNVSSTKSFLFNVDKDGAQLRSGNHIDLAAGDEGAVNSHGGAVNIAAGDGTNVNRGSGGSVSIAAGNGAGVSELGGAGLGGDIELQAGSADAQTKLHRTDT